MPVLKEQIFNSSLGKSYSILRLKRTHFTINFPIDEEAPDDSVSVLQKRSGMI